MRKVMPGLLLWRAGGRQLGRSRRHSCFLIKILTFVSGVFKAFLIRWLGQGASSIQAHGRDEATSRWERLRALSATAPMMRTETASCMHEQSQFARVGRQKIG